MRPSIDSARIAEPRYSITWPMPPLVPISPRIARMTSLAVEPSGSSPSTVTDIHFGRSCGSVCVARTCSTSLVPMPNAIDPNAPCVAVCESPHTMVMPGSVRPCSGPMTWTMPWPGSPIGKLTIPNSAVFARRVSICFAEIGSAIGWSMSAVGTLWSSVATVNSGRRTPRPESRRPSKAWGLVTSWMRCRSTYNRSGSPGAACTTWRSQTFSGNVLPMSFSWRCLGAASQVLGC